MEERTSQLKLEETRAPFFLLHSHVAFVGGGRIFRVLQNVILEVFRIASHSN